MDFVAILSRLAEVLLGPEGEQRLASLQADPRRVVCRFMDLVFCSPEFGAGLISGCNLRQLSGGTFREAWRGTAVTSETWESALRVTNDALKQHPGTVDPGQAFKHAMEVMLGRVEWGFVPVLHHVAVCWEAVQVRELRPWMDDAARATLVDGVRRSLWKEYATCLLQVAEEEVALRDSASSAA